MGWEEEKKKTHNLTPKEQPPPAPCTSPPHPLPQGSSYSYLVKLDNLRKTKGFLAAF